MTLTKQEALAEYDRLAKIIREELVVKWDEGADKYGGDPDLLSRDWINEAKSEGLDLVWYCVFQLIKWRREEE